MPSARRFLSFALAPVLVAGAGLTTISSSFSDQDPSFAPVSKTSQAAKKRHARVRVRGEFNLATFNVLGNDHTNGKRKRNGYASGVQRMRHTVAALRNNDVHVVALQEFEDEQWRAFRKLTKGRYGLFADKRQSANAVAWRKSKFDFVRGRTIGVPYFRGNIHQMPVAFLRHRATNQTMAFTSFHNPVTSKRRPGNDKWRKRATGREIRLATNLRRRGYVAFLAGDFNERTSRWHCRVARATNMVTAGNGVRRGGSCKPLKRMRIDWVFGSNGVRFSNYRALETRLTRRASDHPLIVTHVS